MLSYRLCLAENCENSCAGLGKKYGTVKKVICTTNFYHRSNGNIVLSGLNRFILLLLTVSSFCKRMTNKLLPSIEIHKLSCYTFFLFSALTKYDQFICHHNIHNPLDAKSFVCLSIFFYDRCCVNILGCT